MNSIMEKTNLEREFDDIENKKLWKIVLMSLREETEKLTKYATFDNARKPINRTRNRYRDVLSYDETRVRLLDMGPSDYINASYVNLDNNLYGRRYVLTQGPLVTTISHFWKMVWDENSNCIIMLNKIIEKDAIKCAPYYPNTENENNNHIYSEINLSVSFVDSQINKAYIKRTFLLHNQKTQESRRITQFHYQSWPDFGVPNSSEYFLQFLWDVRSSGGLDDVNKPAIVHCSAGIGRSGTFVLIDLALLQIAEERSCESVNLQQMLLELRKCRLGLIQTAEQLRFAYSSVISGAKALLDNGNTDPKLIKFNDYCAKSDSEPIDGLSSENTDHETDSDISENSENNSALDKAAAAVRTRRGLPAKNDPIYTPINFNNKNADCPTDSIGHSAPCNIEHDRKIVREMRCNRTKKIIEEIRSNMRRQDLQRDRILCRLGLDRWINTLTRQNRTSLIAGASALVGFLSFACGYALYKFVN